MKNTAVLSFLIFISAFSNHSYCQLWKQYTDSANTYNNKKNTDKAIEFYSKAIEELRKDSAGTDIYANICKSLGTLFYEAERYKESETYYLESKQIKEKLFGKISPEYVTSCNNLARLYRSMKQYEKSESFYLESKQILEKALENDRPDYANVCNNLALLYMDMRQYKKAEPILLISQEINEKILGKKHKNYATACNNLALLYYEMKEFKKAEPLYIEAIQIRETLFGKEHPDCIKSCKGLSLLYTDMRQYEKAELLSLEVKRIQEKQFGNKHPDYATACFNLAIVYYEERQYDKAKPLYLEAKQIRENVLGRENDDYAQSCFNLAILYSDVVEYEKAELLFIEAKQIQEKVLGKDHPDYAASCNSLGILYMDMGQNEKAESLLFESKQIREKIFGKNHPDYAQSCHNLALVYRNMKQYEKSMPLYLEAKQIHEKTMGKENPDYATYCNNLAALYADMGQYNNAEPLYLEEKKILEKTPENPKYAHSCNNLAGLYMEMGQYEKAMPLFIEAKQVYEKTLGKQHPDYGLSCGNLASLYWMLNQPLLAEKELKESFSVKAYNMRAVFQFTNEKEKTAFVRNKFGEDDRAYSFYVSQKIESEQPYSLALFHRNLILSSAEFLKKQILSSDDAGLINKYNELCNLKKHLSVLYSQPIDERKEDAIKIEEKADLLEKDITRLSSVFAKEQQKADWNDIKNKLQLEEASIEFVSFHYCNAVWYTDTIIYLAVVVRKDKRLPVMIRLFNEKQLTDLLSGTGNRTNNENINWLYAQSSAGGNSNSIANKSLYDLIWKPLEKELKGIKTIYFSPAGLLHRIAFSALPVNNKEVLSDRYKLVQLATTASVIDQQPYYVSASDKLQLYGAINYDADSTAIKNTVVSYAMSNENRSSLPEDLSRGEIWKELPGTQEEVDAIKNESSTNYTVSALSGINATEESMKALDGKNSPAVLHIASHGFFFPDPKDAKTDTMQKYVTSGKVFKQSNDPLFRSGILFAGANNAWRGKPIQGIEDGILTAYEVSNMYLPNTKLVVLSACETALGDIQGSEGVYGLQRAFKMAGAQTLVMSLWKVPDAETAEFMQLFYKNLFAKQTISNAFYDAQQVMKNKYLNEPYKWASWVLVR